MTPHDCLHMSEEIDTLCMTRSSGLQMVHNGPCMHEPDLHQADVCDRTFVKAPMSSSLTMAVRL